MSLAVCDILTAERVGVGSDASGPVRSKAEVLTRLAELLSRGAEGVSAPDVERVLAEREGLQSTGVGSGIAIPHGSSDAFPRLVAAVLLCPRPIPFEAIDHEPVSIFFSVIGPRHCTGDHLKALARISRLLRDEGLRERLLHASTGAEAYGLLAAAEGRPAEV
jgi:PTS system nitrogen regulatory IIA component